MKRKRTGLTRIVEDSIQTVFFMAGLAIYGPKWWSAVAIGVWIARAISLRLIWRREDDGEWFCRCPVEKNWNGHYVKACSICGAERPL